MLISLPPSTTFMANLLGADQLEFLPTNAIETT